VENQSENVMRCPRCFGRDVRPSRRGSFLDSVMGKLRRAPYRCRGCHNRFYVYIPREKDDLDDAEEIAGVDENSNAQDGHPDDEGVHKPDVAKPAEP